MRTSLLGKPLEALPVLVSRQQIRFQRRVREYKQPSQNLSPAIFQLPDVAPQGAHLQIVVKGALDGIAVVFVFHLHVEIAASQESVQPDGFIQTDAPEQERRPRIVKNQLVVIVKQDDALVNTFKHIGFQPVQHSVGGIVEAAPVQQERDHAVSADGIVQQVVHVHTGIVQEHGVD